MTRYLHFLNTTVRFDIDEEAKPSFTAVLRFFRHLLGTQSARPPTFTVRVRAYHPEHDVDPAVWDVEPSVIRRSSAAAFNFDAHVVDQRERRLYVNSSTLLDAPRDALRDGTFGLRVTAASAVQVIDFVRDLIIRNEESHGTVVLHAAGVRHRDAAVLAAGSKGAGKTTTLLSSMRRPGCAYFTGDKVFCSVGPTGEVAVYPWRDYPYVGVGTIRAHPDLLAWVREHVAPDLDDLEAGDKVLIDPDAFEAWLGSPFDARPERLAAILLPEVRPGEPMRASLVTNPGERWACLNRIVDRQADTTFFTWQSYLVPDYAAFYASLSRMRELLADVPMMRLRGALDVDLDALLDREVLA